MTDYKPSEYTLDRLMDELQTTEILPTRDNKVNSSVLLPSLEDKALYGIAGEIVKTLEPQSEADPVAILVNFLTSFGSIIGNKSYVYVGADKQTPRLFTVLVGETSKARKGLSWTVNKRILETVEPEWINNIQSGLSTGEGLIFAVRDEIIKKEPIKEKGRITGYQEVTVDPGVLDKRCLVLEQEFSSTLRVMGRDGNTLSAVVRQAWDTGDLRILTKNSPARATNAHISIIGHITRDELIKYLANVETANGFGNRFLWLFVKRSKELPFGGDISKINFTPLTNKIREAIEFAKQCEEITWADDAKPLWAKVYTPLSSGKPGLIGSMTARAEAITLRLALIYALLDKSKVIHLPHLEAALALWNYAEDSVRYIFKNRTGNNLADEIYNLLQNNPHGLNRTQISNIFNGHKTSEQISSSLNLLLSLNLAKVITVDTSGRPIEVWKTS